MGQDNFWEVLEGIIGRALLGSSLPLNPPSVTPHSYYSDDSQANELASYSNYLYIATYKYMYLQCQA